MQISNAPTNGYFLSAQSGNTGGLTWAAGATGYTGKAWVNFNGTGTISIRRSENVDSLTDYGVGNYGVNIDVNLSANNYAVGGSAGYSAAAGARGAVYLDVPTNGVTAGQCRVLTTTAAFYDCNHVSVICME